MSETEKREIDRLLTEGWVAGYLQWDGDMLVPVVEV